MTRNAVIKLFKAFDKQVSKSVLQLAQTFQNTPIEQTFIKGKTVLITGGTGIQAKATAYQLAKHGARRIILGCRNESAGNDAVAEIFEKLPRGDNSTSFRVVHLDLASLDSVWDFADCCRRTENELHVLINNASTFGETIPTATVDGNELTFQTNYLSHFLLTVNLMELLMKSAPSRIINVAASHASTSMMCPRGLRIDDLNFATNPQQYSQMKAFAQSKLSLSLFTTALNKRLEEKRKLAKSNSGVSVFTVGPGVIRPQALMGLPWPIHIFSEPILRSLFKMPGEQIVFCASKLGMENWTGKFIQNNQVSNPGRIVNDVMAEKLFERSKKMTEIRGHYPALSLV